MFHTTFLRAYFDFFMQACKKSGQVLAGRETFIDLAKERAYDSEFKSPRVGGARYFKLSHQLFIQLLFPVGNLSASFKSFLFCTLFFSSYTLR